MKRLLILCSCAALVTLLGCELAPSGSTPGSAGSASDQISEEQLKLLEDIKTIQSQTGQSIQALTQGFQEAEQRALAEQGLPGIVEDIAAANGVLADATEAAQLKEPVAAAASLARLRGIADSMLAEMPARLITRHCERALVYLHLGQPKVAEASAELTTAYDITVRNSDPAVVQALITQAKSHLVSSDIHNAGKVIESIIAKTAAEQGAVMLVQMTACLDGADDALARKAWPVLLAELLEVRRVLDDLSGRVQFKENMARLEPAPAPAADTSTTTGTGEATGAAGTGAAATTPAPATPAQPAPAPAPAAATGTAAPAPPVVAAPPAAGAAAPAPVATQ